jgi:hypothetical protein
MKSLIKAGALSLTLAGGLGLTALQAHDAIHKTPAEQAKVEAEHLTKLTKELNLSPDQQNTVRSAMDAKHQKMQQAMDEFDSTVRAALTPDQLPKFDKMEAKRG